jgi:hypothetical protein
MNKTLFAVSIALAMSFTAAHAADNKQQSKMATCNKDAGEVGGPI